MRTIHAAIAAPHVRPIDASSAASPTQSIDADTSVPLPVRPIGPAVAIEKSGKMHAA